MSSSEEIAAAIQIENKILNDKKDSYLKTKFRRITLKGIEKGLAVNTSYTEESPKSYSSFWAIRMAKNRCATKYNAGSPMPYYAIVHQGNNKFKYYIFDSMPENMATGGDYSTVNIEKTGLTLTIPGFDGQSGQVTLNKDSMTIPEHYKLSNGNKVRCKKTSVNDVEDVARMNVERRKKCRKKRDEIVRSESIAKDVGLVNKVNLRLGFTPMDTTSLYEGYTGYEGATNMKSKLADVSSYRYSHRSRDNSRYYRDASSKLNEMKKYENATKADIKEISKYNKTEANRLTNALNKHKKDARTVNKNNLKGIKRTQRTFKRHSRNYGRSERRRSHIINRAKGSKRWNSWKRRTCHARSRIPYWGMKCRGVKRSCRWTGSRWRRRRSCRWKKRCWRTRKSRRNHSKYNRCRRTHNNRINSLNRVIRRETPRRNSDAWRKIIYNGISNRHKADAKRFVRNPSTKVDGKRYYMRKEMGGFGNMNNDSQEGFTSTSNMNCNSGSVYSNFDSHSMTKKVTVVNAVEHILKGNTPNPLSGSVFNTDAVGACRSASGITNQEMTINYSIDHKLENITIVKIDRGKITYKVTGKEDIYTFIMTNVDAKMTLDNNGNLKLGSSVLCNNGNIKPYKPKSIFRTETLSSLNANNTIEGGKYKFELGSSFNTNKLTYASVNSSGNKGVRGHKYTEQSHITGSDANTNIFVVYKLNTYNLPPTQKFLLEGRLYSIVKKATATDCGPNTCFIRQINESYVTHNNLGESYIEMNSADLTGLPIKGIFDGNGGKNINELNTAIIPEIKTQVGVIDNIGRESFTSYSNEGFGTMLVEGLSEAARDTLRKDIDKTAAIMTTFNADRQKLQNNIADISSNWDFINTNAETINDEYDARNNIIPFVFDACGNRTDFYRTEHGYKDPQAKVDAVKEDQDEMLRQQNTLYTLGSLTAATFLVTAILLARN